MYMYFSGSDCVVAECIYTSGIAAMIAVSDITTSAVVAADDSRIRYNNISRRSGRLVHIHIYTISTAAMIAASATTLTPLALVTKHS